jgi:hypothetical protein
MPVELLLAMARLRALEAYREEVHRLQHTDPGAACDVMRAALLIASFAAPQLEVDELLRDVDNLAARCMELLGVWEARRAAQQQQQQQQQDQEAPAAQLSPLQGGPPSALLTPAQRRAAWQLGLLRALRSVLFSEGGFAANTLDPHDPLNRCALDACAACRLEPACWYPELLGLGRWGAGRCFPCFIWMLVPSTQLVCSCLAGTCAGLAPAATWMQSCSAALVRRQAASWRGV